MGINRNVVTAGAVLSAFFLVLLVCAKLFILERFTELEEEQTRRNMERVMDGVGSELTAIERTVVDWAEWDDARRFLLDGNPAFAKRNLTYKTIDNLKVSVIVLVTNEGKIRFAGEADSAAERLIPVREGLRSHFLPGSPLMVRASPRKSITGILLLPEGPLLVSCRPILDSFGKGPSPGLLLMGRQLDSTETGYIGRTAHISFSLLPISDKLQPLVRDIERLPRGSSPVAVRIGNNELIDGYSLLRDIYGRPALIVHAGFPRTIHEMGSEAILYFLAWIMGILSISAVGGLVLYRQLSRSRREKSERDELYRTVIDQSSEGILLMDTEEGTILEANRGIHAMLGYGNGELVGLHLSEIAGDERQSIAEWLHNMALDTRPKTSEHILLRKDGAALHAKTGAGRALFLGKEIICLSVHDITDHALIEKALRKTNEDLEMWVETRTAELSAANAQLMEDIEERKRVEAKLRKEESIRGMVFEAIPDMIAVIDPSYRIVHSNWGAGYDYVPEEVRTNNPYCYDAFYPGRGKLCEPCHAQEVFRTGRPLFKEKFNPSIGYMEIRAYPIFDETGKVSLVVEHIRDITEHKKLEEEILKSQKLESLGVLAGGIAHDFNNLLTSVLGNISLSRLLAVENERLTRRLDDAEKATLRAGDLTRQLLTFSRGGAPVKKVVSIKQIVLDSVSFALRGSNVRCDFHLPDNLLSVEADPSQISQVVNNLIINADQSMPDGGVISVGAENARIGEEELPTLPAGSYVKLSVRDGGCGIAEENMDKIFDPYFTTKPKGTGLGLATVYSIIRKHEGLITVDSIVGKGSTFHIYLPALESEAAPTDSPTRHAMKGTGRILVMDDEEVIREVACEILRHLGYEVESCSCGKEAVRIYESAMAVAPFSAVLMDLTIPGGMGGKETMSQLLRIDPEVKGIVSSGYSNDPILANHSEYGFRGVVMKPYDIVELGNALHQVLQPRQ
jgi:PAS domain S-box-containing protein